MSLLNAIKLKKNNLKATDTCVTHLDGRKFLQSQNTCLEVAGQAYGFVVDEKPDNIPAKIMDFLYLGSQDCCDLVTLSNYGIKFVLSIGIEAPNKYPNITYKFVQCLDLPESNIESSLREDCVPFIESAVKQSYNVLVHCNAGVSRSASVVIGYLILVHKFNFKDAYNHVKSARGCIKPNSGFEKQLNNLM